MFCFFDCSKQRDKNYYILLNMFYYKIFCILYLDTGLEFHTLDISLDLNYILLQKHLCTFHLLLNTFSIIMVLLAGRDLNPRTQKGADLQSAAFNHFATYQFSVIFVSRLTGTAMGWNLHVRQLSDCSDAPLQRSINRASFTPQKIPFPHLGSITIAMCAPNR